MVVLFLVFWETLLFAIVAALITFPPTVYKFPYSPHSRQRLLSVVLLMIAILTGMKWYLVVLISLMTSGVEHHFICLLAICILSLEKCVNSSEHFEIELLIVLMWSCMSCLYILDINPLLDIWFANVSAHSLGWLFIFVEVSFAVQKLLSLIRSHLFFLSFPLP